MDDEAAEIELLEQNLNKTHQISQRMVSILSSFDTRLNKLEKSVLPLYNTTQILTRRANNIESALQKIDDVASNQEGIAAEEALILRGPQPGQLNVYKEALERLNASIAFKSSDRDSRDTARLVESGAKKLTQLYTKLVAEASAITPPAGPTFNLTPFPQQLLLTLDPLTAFLRALPVPATHPSHPAAQAIQSALKDAQRGYADMRGNYAKRCLEVQAKRVVDRADTIDGVASGREFGAWVDNMLTVAEAECKLLSDLAPLPSPQLISSAYSTLLAPLLNLFNSTVSSLQALIKRSLSRHTFLALSAFESTQTQLQRSRELLVERAGRSKDDLRDAVQALKNVCLRSFPEFLADVKMAGLGSAIGPGASRAGMGNDMSTGLADFCITTVAFLERFPEVEGAAGAVLAALGDGKWKMGEGVQVGKNATGPGDVDQRTIIEHYIYDVVNTTITSLTTISRSQRRPAFGTMFLLNNVTYLRTRLLDNPRTDISSLLSKPARDALNSAARTAKAAYFDSNFSPLMQALADDPKDKGRSAAKEKATRFFDLLEEVSERHRVAKVLDGDDQADERETLAEEVAKLVVPSLNRFTQKNRDTFSKNPQKYLKMTADGVEAQIRGFYNVSRCGTALYTQNAWPRKITVNVIRGCTLPRIMLRCILLQSRGYLWLVPSIGMTCGEISAFILRLKVRHAGHGPSRR
ncbi:hypothetical protein PUNSTDRAFT_120310 [Punctularia strigosozonata HHB-11173 SS5]|uniref:uncharacterized protein n=1 Tax=Punctularia strigosozonata (strain HHB-11173) TaxID=741275 RepID=UPI00044177BC|nr:uncharacterized protein PUNSTDRAFT_120310 [Punctularia strigosozonata HHB-11173 SS5]EIN08701.1 hypothetical protein PUNSTDRAFT_120310 [Punctularia strigosozonata HHB-11173 SS5]